MDKNTVTTLEEQINLMKAAKNSLASADRKIASAGGLFKVANHGVELGANSWASNVENYLHNTNYFLDELLRLMEGKNDEAA